MNSTYLMHMEYMHSTNIALLVCLVPLNVKADYVHNAGQGLRRKPAQLRSTNVLNTNLGAIYQSSRDIQNRFANPVQ